MFSYELGGYANADAAQASEIATIAFMIGWRCGRGKGREVEDPLWG